MGPLVVELFDSAADDRAARRNLHALDQAVAARPCPSETVNAANHAVSRSQVPAAEVEQASS